MIKIVNGGIFVLLIIILSINFSLAQNSNCIVNWVCGYWSECEEGYQKITCKDINQCDITNKEYTKTQPCNSIYEIVKIPQEPNILINKGGNLSFIASFKNDEKKDYIFKWYINEKLFFEDKGSGSIFRESFFNNSIVRVEIKDNNFLGNVFWMVNISGAEITCVENWQCQWRECKNYISLANDCFDTNNCGSVFDKPVSRTCGCNSKVECGEWSSCLADYDFNQVFNGQIITNGKKSRICYDINHCINNSIEKEECSISIPIYSKKANKCNSQYIEIYELESNKLVSNIKNYNSQLGRKVDVGFNANEFEAYCSYCFDGIKNYDEEEIDCGGQQCPKCKIKTEYKDNIWIIKSILSLILIVLCVCLIFYTKQETKINNSFFNRDYRQIDNSQNQNKNENKTEKINLNKNIFDIRQYVGRI